MSVNTGNAPAWLFSFLDLAFLILIALLHTGERERDPVPDFAALELPEIERANTDPFEPGSFDRWQVRVHPRRAPQDDAAFSLVSGDPDELSDEVRIASLELKRALTGLRDQSGAAPFLAPHRDSRAEDFLIALSFVQATWPANHVGAVRPVASLDPVASPHPVASIDTVATLPKVSTAPTSAGLP